VLAYGLTVVDLALVIGPGSPPTLAVLAWQDLGDADPQRNAPGASAACCWPALLAGARWSRLAGWPGALRPGVAWPCRLAARAVALAARPCACAALHGRPGGLLVVYAGVCSSLLLLAVAGPWPFPAAVAAGPGRWRTAGNWSTDHGQQPDTIGLHGLLALAAPWRCCWAGLVRSRRPDLGPTG
jgi:ABC-type uncharacterized transport system YnjBCD permease subunit